jgi:glycogen(starch) synthase
MRILHLGQLYYPAVGGAEIHLKELSERIAAMGEDVLVMTSHASNGESLVAPLQERTIPVSAETVNAVKVKRLRINYWLYQLLFKMRGTYRLQKLFGGNFAGAFHHIPFTPQLVTNIVDYNPDMVLAINSCSSFPRYAYMARKIKKFPLAIIPCMHFVRSWSDDPGVYEILKTADLVIALTEFEKRLLVSKGVLANKVIVIGPGITTPLPISPSDDIQQTQFSAGMQQTVLFVGRKVENKGLDTLIDAMDIVWDAIPNVKLVLAGTRTAFYDKVIIRQIESLDKSKRERIVSIDNFSSDAKTEIFSNCDIFVLPSKVESFGIVYLEAWAHKKPVIGCKGLAPESVISAGLDGLLTEYGNPQDLAQAIMKLLNDRPLQKKMGEHGYKKVLENYTWDIVAKKIHEQYCRMQQGAS